MVLDALQTNTSPGASADRTRRGWRLYVPAGAAGAYRLSQVDDYHDLARIHFPYRAPLMLSLRARASKAAIPGTWGFGLWNDPFSFSLGFGGKRRFPALPNSAWFFFASPENHLSLRNTVPGNGALAASFRSPRIPALLLGPAALGLPLLMLRPLSRWMRWAASRITEQDGMAMNIQVNQWHSYRVKWEVEQVFFEVDGQQVLQSAISPRGPLGLVIWLDNQYAAWKPDGRLAYGTLPTPEDSWIEIEDLKISPTS